MAAMALGNSDMGAAIRRSLWDFVRRTGSIVGFANFVVGLYRFGVLDRQIRIISKLNNNSIASTRAVALAKDSIDYLKFPVLHFHRNIFDGVKDYDTLTYVTPRTLKAQSMKGAILIDSNYDGYICGKLHRRPGPKRKWGPLLARIVWVPVEIELVEGPFKTTLEQVKLLILHAMYSEEHIWNSAAGVTFEGQVRRVKRAKDISELCKEFESALL